MLYKRVGNFGFDNGVIIDDTSVVIGLKTTTRYTALKYLPLIPAEKVFRGRSCQQDLLKGVIKLHLW